MTDESTSSSPTEQNAQPWYQDGLRFRCTQCGNCCSGDPGVVWVDPQEIAGIAQTLGKSAAEVKLMHTRLVNGRVSLTEERSGDCTFFDAETRHCQIYTARPTQCRTWPFWDSNLETEASWEALKVDCPGVGRGDFVSLEEIQRRASEVHI